MGLGFVTSTLCGFSPTIPDAPFLGSYTDHSWGHRVEEIISVSPERGFGPQGYR